MRTAAAGLLLAATTTFATPVHPGEYPREMKQSSRRIEASEIPRLEDLLRVTLVEGFPSTKPNNTLFLSNPDTPHEPVTNKIYLQIANIADHPLYMGKDLWTWNGPAGQVVFQLGDGEEDLTCEYPDDTDKNCPVATTSASSAWNIAGGIDVDYSGGWVISGPTGIGSVLCGHFPIAPQNTNFDILGANIEGAARSSNNLSFSFDQIVSFTPPGRTRVNVSLTNVPFNETHFYNEATLSVELQKLRATRRNDT